MYVNLDSASDTFRSLAGPILERNLDDIFFHDLIRFYLRDIGRTELLSTDDKREQQNRRGRASIYIIVRRSWVDAISQTAQACRRLFPLVD